MSMDINYEDGKLVITRTFDAPREAVFEAWVETSKVQKWWGCGQTTNVRSEIEPKVGGKYVHHMTIEGVGEMPATGTFTIYDPPARLAYDAPDPMSGNVMTVTVDFEEVDGKTQVRLVHENIPDQFSPYVKNGWTAAFDKLDNFVTTEV